LRPEAVWKYGTFANAETPELDKELEAFVRRTRQVYALAKILEHPK
jgi:hypothetical protein